MAKFKGGVSTCSKKYLKITSGPHRGRRVHLMIAEAMLGRPLRPDEEVDHKDGDRLNCDYTNLQVMSGSDHTRLENRRRWVLRHIEEKGRKRWEEWIETGGARPGGAGAAHEDSSFNPEEFGNESEENYGDI